MNKTFTNPAAYGNQFRKKYVLPNQKTLKYMYGKGRKKTFQILEGPIRSGKTTDNIIRFCQEVEKSKETTHLTMGVTQGAAKTILWEHGGLGIAHYPDWQERVELIDGKKIHFPQRIFITKYQKQDALALMPKPNSGHPIKYIVAFGAKTKSDHQPYTGYDVGVVIATQWEFFHRLSRAQILKRTANSDNRIHYIDLNPTAPEHEIYKEFDRWLEKGRANFMLKLMQDNPVMTDERIAQVMEEYDPDSVDYKRDILGQRAAAEGLIYKVREDNIIKEFDPNDYRTYVISADPGVNSSATTFALIAITNDRKNIDVLKGYYHKNKDKQGMAVKMPSDYAKDYQQFIKECIALMGRPPEDVLSDLDTTFMREFRRTKYQAKLAGITLNSKFRKDEIHQRIKTGINLLWTKRLRFYHELEPFITAYKTASYDEKQKDKGKYVRYDNPQAGTMIDPIDTVEYGITRLRTYINEWRG